MKSQKLLLTITLTCILFSCKKAQLQPPDNQAFSQPFKVNHSKSAAIQTIIDEYTKKGIPGIAVAIKDQEGIWEGASGVAKIESQEKLTTGFVHAGASITKTYTATAILLLEEQGLVNLDHSITQYLPASVTSKINNASAITVRMLLNHTSGIPDYISDTNFRLHWQNDLSQGWTADEALSYIYNKPLLFTPGTDFTYSNTNYILLSLLIEHVTKKKEGVWLEEQLLNKADLKHTYYKVQKGYLEGLPMPNYYFDIYSDGRLQNITTPTKVEIYSELGDGGLVATPIDFVSFMDHLINGKIITPASLNKMKSFGKGEYGLGLETGYNYKNKVQYGHMGAVLGGASLLLYFEEQQTSLFIASNIDASLFTSNTLMLYHEMKNKISEYVASH